MAEMDKIVAIPGYMTKKTFMDRELSKMEVGDSFPVDRKDSGKWAYHISVYMHPRTDKKFLVQTDRDKVPAGEALIWRIA